MSAPDWDVIDRMLYEMCDGPHGGTSLEIYRLERPDRGDFWLCKTCWVRAWVEAGRPAQRRRGSARGLYERTDTP